MAIVASGQVTLSDLNDAKQLAMYIGASQSRSVIYNGVSTYTPNYATTSTNQVLTPQLFVAGTNADIANQASSIRWFYQLNGAGTPVEITQNTSDYTIGTGSVKTLTIKSNVLASRNSVTYICEISYPDTSTGFVVTMKAEIELVKVTNGTNGAKGQDGLQGDSAIIGVLSNDSHTLPSDSNGAVLSYTGASTTLTIYKGTMDDTSNWTISQTRGTGVTVSEAISSKTATVTAVTQDVSTVTFTASKSGHANIIKVFTLTKVKNGHVGSDGKDGTTGKDGAKGEDGQDSTSYWIVSPKVIQKSKKGEFNPKSITVELKSQKGTEVVSPYSGRITIDESVDGSTFTRKYTSSSNEASKEYTPSQGITALRVRMYLSGIVPNNTNYIDEEKVLIVSDGEDSTYVNVWSPEGNTIKNGTGSVYCQADTYNGSDVIVGTSYKWYVQDSTATTSSGGDLDGGSGWRLLTSTYNLGVSGYNTSKITVPASAVTGMESFKVVLVYKNEKFSGVTTVVDLSDPIMVRVDGLDKFKNGEGTITATCTLIQAGEEIDALGTGGYIYQWSIYNANNVKTAFSKTGKQITVKATDINGIGNLVCEVSK